MGDHMKEGILVQPRFLPAMVAVLTNYFCAAIGTFFFVHMFLMGLTHNQVYNIK